MSILCCWLITNRVPTFPDWQNSMIFPGFSKEFQVYFVNIFNVASNYFWINVYIKISPNQKYIISTGTQDSHISRRTKFHDISIIFLQNSMIFPGVLYFSSKCGNPDEIVKKSQFCYQPMSVKKSTRKQDAVLMAFMRTILWNFSLNHSGKNFTWHLTFVPGRFIDKNYITHHYIQNNILKNSYHIHPNV